jgi:putative transposase
MRRVDFLIQGIMAIELIAINYLEANDLHSNKKIKIIQLSNTLDAESSHKVLREAIKNHGKPQIMNSDQGSQFTCKEWVSYLNKEEISISMDGKGRALDNLFIERLWRSVKYDYVYLNPAQTEDELYRGLTQYFLTCQPKWDCQCQTFHYGW